MRANEMKMLRVLFWFVVDRFHLKFDNQLAAIKFVRVQPVGTMSLSSGLLYTIDRSICLKITKNKGFCVWFVFSFVCKFIVTRKSQRMCCCCCCWFSSKFIHSTHPILLWLIRKTVSKSTRTPVISDKKRAIYELTWDPSSK